MSDPSDAWKITRDVWSRIRSFGTLWLALTSLGGFVVLIGGPWILGLLTGIFGPEAAKPGRVISLNMIFTLPFAVYFWIQQHRLAEGNVACAQCGEHYPKTNASCPMCGCANSTKDKPTAENVPAARS